MEALGCRRLPVRETDAYNGSGTKANPESLVARGPVTSDLPPDVSVSVVVSVVVTADSVAPRPEE